MNSIDEQNEPIFRFENTFADLPGQFYASLPPTKVTDPYLIAVNDGLALELGLDPEALRSRAATEIMAGNRIDTSSRPIAMAYAGHQFGGWVPQLGDGRALLLGEVIDLHGRRMDIQLKGSGPTPFSRMGDGRAWIGPVIREYVVSEAMRALGIPTTRALAALGTGEQVYRERPYPGGILVRVASCFVRVGTLQYFAARRDIESLRILLDYVRQRLYPEIPASPDFAFDLFETIGRKQMELIAKWMSVGFIHGVMNTDNMSLAAETIDYGPCAFIDDYSAGKVFSSIDHGGRYAYGNQPRIAIWNLGVLASCLLFVVDRERDEAIGIFEDKLDGFADHYREEYLRLFKKKLGILNAESGDEELVASLLSLLESGGVDFTQAFRRLTESEDSANGQVNAGFADLFKDRRGIDNWLAKWRIRTARSSGETVKRKSVMKSANPVLIPRNHRIEEVIVAALDADYGPLESLTVALAHPYEDRAEFADYQLPPTASEVVTRTFCGT